ncbi:MAG TPA: hypothetical protein VM734_24670 [Kofleriaceae bacterium]|nr:hypothetical protein [Kofleriaceae bacterium]
MAGRVSSWWKLVIVVALGAAVARGGACACRSSVPQPDERLAGHFRKLCRIAERGIEAPDEGVRRLMRYYGDHGPDMLAAFGETLVTIERIDDDRAHDQRARVARDRLRTPLDECAETWEEFGDAIAADPVASERLERGVERLARTLNIILGEDAATLAPWPDTIARRIEAALARRR